MHAVSPLLLAALLDTQLMRWIVWVGLVLLTVALLLLVRTRWGQSKPLTKCVVLSLLAHSLLAIYISTVNIVTSAGGVAQEEGVQVALVDHDASDDEQREAAPWDNFVDPSVEETLEAVPDLSAAAPTESAPELADPRRLTPVEPRKTSTPAKPAPLPAAEDAGPPQIVGGEDAPTSDASAKDVQPIEEPPAEDPKQADLVPPPEPAQPGEVASDGASSDAPDSGAGSDASSQSDRVGADAPPLVPIAARPGSNSSQQEALPEVLKLRTGDHAKVARGLGATQQSEQAVGAALAWLAANQSASGRWEPRQTGAGTALAQDAKQRRGAGQTADTGLTGLALLSFLAAGNTHLNGEYQINVRRGLEFLLGMQEADGNLGASHNVYEKMYCHAMATCAISEAYAMTRDDRLRAAVRRAINYTLNAQDHTTGGWRYRPGDPGDTSQLGWQVMALKSAQLGGFEIPDATRTGIERFLKSVALGPESGLACYQAIRPVPTRSMTAEALVCRQFMDMVDGPAAVTQRPITWCRKCRAWARRTFTTGTMRPWRSIRRRATPGSSGTRPCKPS